MAIWLVKDKIHGFFEVLKEIVGHHRRFPYSISCAHADGYTAGIFSGLYIAFGITNHHRSREVDVELFRSFLKHPGFWLTAVTIYFIYRIFLGITFIRMMRAIVNAIKPGPLFTKVSFKLAVNGFNIFNGTQVAGNRRLVGNHHGQISGLIHAPHCLRSKFIYFHIFRPADEVFFFVQNAITVKEKCLFLMRIGSSCDLTRIPVVVHFFQPFRCAHVLQVLSCMISNHPYFIKNSRKDLPSEIRIFPLFKPFQDGGTEYIDPCIHQVPVNQSRRMRLRMKSGYPARDIHFNQITVGGMIVWVQNQRAFTAFNNMKGNKPVEVHIHHYIAIKDKEVIPDLAFNFLNAPGCTKRFAFFEIGYRYTKSTAISKIIHNGFLHVIHQDDNIGYAIFFKQFNLMLQKRFFTDLQHGFRNFLRKFRQPASFSSGYNNCLHGDYF